MVKLKKGINSIKNQQNECCIFKKTIGWCCKNIKVKKMEFTNISHSFSFSGPKYIVKDTDIKMSRHPTSRPKEGATLKVPMPHNCDMAACNTLNQGYWTNQKKEYRKWKRECTSINMTFAALFIFSSCSPRATNTCSRNMFKAMPKVLRKPWLYGC